VKERAASDLHGVLVVDKPRGPTSHDVVAQLRRVLGTRRVGHAGTLDPMASGVLVALVGEATKLGPYLTAHEKYYEARVVFGRATATLDAEGDTTDEQPVPIALREALQILQANPDGSSPDEAVLGWLARIRAALDAERARALQIPPAYSAIKVQGEKSYARARAGEQVELEPRAVSVSSIRVRAGYSHFDAPSEPQSALHGGLSSSPSPPSPSLDLTIGVSKGYYVRSLARDLGAALGLPAHLGGLRRTASGPFVIADAARIDEGAERLRAALRPLADAARAALPAAELHEMGAARAGQGKRLTIEDFVVPPPGPEPCAWLDPSGRLVAVGEGAEGLFQVRRGFGATERKE
jgi:tRNA pseudouridine55 synthase